MLQRWSLLLGLPFGEFGLDLVFTVSAKDDDDVDGAISSSPPPAELEVDWEEPGGVETGKTPCKESRRFKFLVYFECFSRSVVCKSSCCWLDPTTKEGISK